MIKIPIFVEKKAEELETEIDLVKQNLLNALQSIPAPYFADRLDTYIHYSDEDYTYLTYESADKHEIQCMLIPDLSGDYACSLITQVLKDISYAYHNIFEYSFKSDYEYFKLCISLKRIQNKASDDKSTDVMSNFQTFIKEKSEYLNTYEKKVEAEILNTLREIPTIRFCYPLDIFLSLEDGYSTFAYSYYNIANTINNISLEKKDYHIISDILFKFAKNYPEHFSIISCSKSEGIKFRINIQNTPKPQ